MSTVYNIIEVLKHIKSLKEKLINAQDFENASIMREMEKEYLDKKMKL